MVPPGSFLVPQAMPWHVPTAFPPEVLQQAGLRPQHPGPLHHAPAHYMGMGPARGPLPGTFHAVAMMPPFEYMGMAPIHPAQMRL